MEHGGMKKPSWCRPPGQEWTVLQPAGEDTSERPTWSLMGQPELQPAPALQGSMFTGCSAANEAAYTSYSGTRKLMAGSPDPPRSPQHAQLRVLAIRGPCTRNLPGDSSQFSSLGSALWSPSELRGL